MKQDEMQETIRTKNKLIINQTRRITLLEDKLSELRRSYFQLKHSDILVHLKRVL